MLLHWRAQNKKQPLKINMRVAYLTVFSVWNKPLIVTCQHCSTNRVNQALRSLANAGFQNRGDCLQAFPSFPSPSPHFHFLALVSFLARSKLRIPFVGLSLLRNRTETLATQAKFIFATLSFPYSAQINGKYALNVGMLQKHTEKALSLSVHFFSEFPAFRKVKYSSYLAAILDDVIVPHEIQQNIICTLFSRSRPELSNKPKIV